MPKQKVLTVVDKRTDEYPARSLLFYATSVFSNADNGYRFHVDCIYIPSALSMSFQVAKIICRSRLIDRYRDYVQQAKELIANSQNVCFDLTDTPSSTLYSTSGVITTHISAFAFVHEWLIRRRVVFMRGEEEGKGYPRFKSLVRQFGRLAGTTEQMNLAPHAQLICLDTISEVEFHRLTGLFGLPFKGPVASKADRLRINDGESGSRWLRLPLAI